MLKASSAKCLNFDNCYLLQLSSSLNRDRNFVVERNAVNLKSADLSRTPIAVSVSIRNLSFLLSS